MERLSEHAKNVVDAASVSVLAGTLLKILPAVAALFTIVWTGMRIYDWIKAKMDENKSPE